MTEQAFDELVKSKKQVLLILGAHWCPACKMTRSSMPKFAADHPDIDAVFVDVERSRRISERLQIATIPTMLFYRDGSLIRRVSGGRDAAGLSKLVGGKPQR